MPTRATGPSRRVRRVHYFPFNRLDGSEFRLGFDNRFRFSLVYG